MNSTNLLKKLGFAPKENVVGIYEKKYPQHNDYSLEVDFSNEKINYGHLITSENKTTQNFKQDENWVVLECVDRLLSKGYKPQNIILEKTWAAGHGRSGRLDICVNREDGTEYLLIECKTFGKEFDKAVSQLNKNGGQLFTYFKFSNKADVIMLYASELRENEISYKNEIVKIEEDYRIGDVQDFYEKWNKLTKDNGLFEGEVLPYCFETKALTKEKLKPITQKDSSFIFNRFLEILRNNVVSDKGNAFNKIFTLFLCKVYDETSSRNDEELKFQWKEGKDDDVSFQIRLTDLYKNGMQKFLSRTVSDFDESNFTQQYKELSPENRQKILKEIEKLRLEKNNEFAIKEVYDHQSFLENARIVKEVVELLQGYRIRYNKRQQYLSDFFELLLTTGLKQESGQFFTPVPIAQFIMKSLPLDKIIEQKLNQKDDELLPYMIDYAAGSGHFITEYMHEVQNILNQKEATAFIEDTAKKIINWQQDHFNWATKYVYGIEKDYRLVKVGKVGCYLHGDGLANVILSDGLASFTKTKDYTGKLKKEADGVKDNPQFDFVLSNPPYSVEAFKQTTRDYYTEEDFELYNCLTENSSEIEALFIERTKQLLKEGGIASVILPSSILNNAGIYAKAREIILAYFDVVAITELGSNTFMATSTSTVVLFLKRRNNFDCLNIKKSVDTLFVTRNDISIHSIEKPVAKYLGYAWKGILFEDYISLLNKEPNDTIKQHDLYKEYETAIKAKNETLFLKSVLQVEKEKLYYFILSYKQKTVLVKTGEKEAEKRFLGYEFSNRRGSEGIHPIQRNKTIEDCTRLFDATTFDNPEKASTYIYQAFNNDFDTPIDKTLEENISRVNLVGLLTFDRADFQNTLSLNAKKKIEIESKWDLVKLEELLDFFSSGITYNKSDVVSQKTKVIVLTADNITLNNELKIKKEIFLRSDLNVSLDKKLKKDDIFICLSSGSKKHIGKVAYIKEELDFYAGGFMGILRCNNRILPKYLYLTFLHPSIKQSLESASSGNNINNLSSKLKKIKIPCPPTEIQEKIVAELGALEEKNKQNENSITQNDLIIENLLNTLYTQAKDTIRLSDTDVFELSIGKRVINKDLQPNGSIPVYSANVYKPFGYVDKLLIHDFEPSSVLWGIDGDWMVNCLPANIPFFPTDHCGVLRIKKDKVLKEKYLEYALRIQGQEIGFSRSKRASLDRVSGIKIPLPRYTDQTQIVQEIEKLTVLNEEAKKMIDETDHLKKAILNKHLNN